MAIFGFLRLDIKKYGYLLFIFDNTLRAPFAAGDFNDIFGSSYKALFNWSSASLGMMFLIISECVCSGLNSQPKLFANFILVAV